MNAFPNWAKNILFLLVYMISGLVLVIIIEGLISGTELMPFNTLLEGAMIHIRTPLLTSTLVMVTNIGSPFVLGFVACIISILLFLRGDRYDALLFLTAMAVAVVSFIVLKNIFQISRPPSEFVDAGGWSFPSGHATVATAFFFILAHDFFGRVKTALGKIVLVVGSIFGAMLISFSRLYLGAHWALDILGGIAVGLLSVSFTVLMFGVFLYKGRSTKQRIGTW